MLLALGLFFTAAFLSGEGALLGNLGRVGVAYLFGAVGVFLAPLAVVAGVLLLLGHLPGRRALGVALLLFAVAATLAARLPDGFRFERDVYVRGGGILGSGIYEIFYQVGGIVGVVLVLALLYAAAVSLLTGITFRRAFESSREALWKASEEHKEPTKREDQQKARSRADPGTARSGERSRRGRRARRNFENEGARATWPGRHQRARGGDARPGRRDGFQREA